MSTSSPNSTAPRREPVPTSGRPRDARSAPAPRNARVIYACRRRRFGGTASAGPRRSSRPPGRCARPGEHVVASAVAGMYDASCFLESDPQGSHLPVGLVRGEPREPHLRVERAFDHVLRQHGFGRELGIITDADGAEPVPIGGPRFGR